MTRTASTALALAAALAVPAAVGCGAGAADTAKAVETRTAGLVATPSPAPGGTPTGTPSGTPSPSRMPRSTTKPTEEAAAAAPSGAAGGSPGVAVVQRGTGRLHVVPGGGRRVGQGPLRRYSVHVEGGLGVDEAGFTRAVEATLADPRSWGAAGRLSFRRVDDGPVDFRVSLASPDTTDRLCAPLRTRGRYSCGSGSRAVINLRRWLTGADAYAGDLVRYRQYVVNHEVGHTLGHGHERCPGRGRPAPVMMQQTKGVGACRPNPWPFPQSPTAAQEDEQETD